MSDSIKREDAIKVVHEYFIEALYKEPTEIDEDGDEVFTDMKSVNKLLTHNKTISKALKELPSAEPQGEFISKVDAKEAVACELHYKLGMDIEMAKGVANVIDALPTPYREENEE